MLPEILINYVEYFNALNVFKYITFRTGGSILTALLISFIFGPYLIKKLKMNQIEGQPIRIDGPKSHLIKKKGTPTMGGILILFAFSFSTLLWAKLDNIYVWTVFSIVSSFGIIGLIDDWLKLTKRSSQGLNGKIKLLQRLNVVTMAN